MINIHINETVNKSVINCYDEFALKVNLFAEDGCVRNAVLNSRIASEFDIVDIDTPTKGTAVLTAENTVKWFIRTLDDNAELTVYLKHNGACGGEFPVNDEVVYNDSEGNTPKIELPTVMVEECANNDEQNNCENSYSVESCCGNIVIDAGDCFLSDACNTAKVKVTLKNVCPGKRVALGVFLSECNDGKEEQIGARSCIVPPHCSKKCEDVVIDSMKFIIPHNDCPCCGGHMKLKASVIAHYVD